MRRSAAALRSSTADGFSSRMSPEYASPFSLPIGSIVEGFRLHHPTIP
jgi:hypothetical protein